MAASQARRDLVIAARESAVDELMRLIEAQPVSDDLTVRHVLDALPASARRELRSLVGGSAQLGGPRFPTPGTAEVQLQANGGELLSKLVALAGASPDRSPMTAADLEHHLGPWRGRVFTATGGSASSAVGPELRARPESLPPSWAGVSEEARLSAYDQARDHAVSQFIETAGHIEILANVPDPRAESTAEDQPGTAIKAPPRRNPLTLKGALQHEGVEAQARTWLSQRPLSRVKYDEDRWLEVKLAVEPGEWVEQLRVTMSRPELGLPEIGDSDWEKFQVELANVLQGPGAREIVGRAFAAETERRPEALQLPGRAPEWTRLPIRIRATAPEVADADPGKRRLATRQAAEGLALADLRMRLASLQVTEQQTLEQCARTHERFGDLLESSLAGARVTDAIYHADGSVTVEVTMSPRALWQALERRLMPPLEALPPQ